MPLPITAIFAGVLACWLMVLQAKVVRFRRAKLVALGDGGHADGERLIRAHANAVENIPVFLILLGLGEGLGTPQWVLVALGLLFTIGRVMHGLHFFEDRDSFSLRFWGMLMTLMAIGVLALGAIAHGLAELL